uniref:Uncharacterized protein n=1 Tax=Zea mays TaxID=4577 RepID=B6SX79_MAIZE|nr:hypothetical protein [Zea mays]
MDRMSLWERKVAAKTSREVTCHLKIILVPGISSPRSRAGTTG